MDYRYEIEGTIETVRVEPVGDGYALTVRGETHQVRGIRRDGGELELVWEDGHQSRAWVVADGDKRWVALDPAPASGPIMLTVPSARARRGRAGGAGTLQAQMPGVVRKVLVVAGDRVERGQVLVLLEAMKMEIRVTAPEAGTVRRVAVNEGESVQRGQVLVEVGP